MAQDSRHRVPAWREGVSRTAIGRFGGLGLGRVFGPDNCFGVEYRAGIPVGQGYLCLAALEPESVTLVLSDKHSIYVWDEQRRRLLHLDVSHRLSRTTHRRWTFTQHVYRCPGGKSAVTITHSLLAPGFLYDVKADVVRWRFDYGQRATHMAAPLAGGAKAGVISGGYRRRRDGALASPWILLSYCRAYDMPFDVPLLFTFENPPTDIAINAAGDTLTMHFAGPCGKLNVTPLFGVSPMLKSETSHWMARGLPDDVRQRCERLAGLARAYPLRCREYYRIDAARQKVQIRDVYEHLCFAGTSAADANVVAPLPPTLAVAAEEGYRVAFAATPVDFDLPTNFGPYRAVPGRELAYELPYPQYVDYTTAPLTVKGDKASVEVTERLADYLADPYLSFGGLMPTNPIPRYDKTVPINNLIALRSLAWATWSVSPSARRRALSVLTAGLDKFGPRNLHHEIEPASGQEFWWGDLLAERIGKADRIFESDTEWYNGMTLAGFWAAYFYGHQDLACVRRHWSTLKKIARYYEIFHDWALGSFWGNHAGHFIWADGTYYGWQGLLGMARLATTVRDSAARNLYVYLAAKTTVLLYVFWHFNSFAERARLPGRGPNYDRHAPLAGFVKSKAPFFQEAWDSQTGHHEGCCVPELCRFFTDHPAVLSKLRHYEYDLVRKHLGQDWVKAVVDAKYILELTGNHFYNLDPHLITRAMVFREDLATLRRYTDKLTGPVLEAYLVGTHPLVLVPTAVRFAGNVWNQRTRTLRLRLQSDTATDIRFLVDLGPHWSSPLRVIGARAEAPAPTSQLLWYRASLPARRPAEITLKFGHASPATPATVRASPPS